MAKKNAQIRFRGIAATVTDGNQLVTGKVFDNYTKNGGIEQLGIQAIPGTKFYLNNSPDPIIIGASGIYELDVTNKALIDAIRFNAQSIQNIKDSNDLSLLIDIVYREG